MRYSFAYCLLPIVERQSWLIKQMKLQMKKIFLTGLLITTTFFVFGQHIDAIINAKEAEHIEKVLSADDMMGRRAFSPYIDKAADFIAGEFKKTGLRTLNNSGSYRQDFAMVTPKFISASCKFDGEAVDEKNVSAKFENGVLTVIAPKIESFKAKQIPIQ